MVIANDHYQSNGIVFVSDQGAFNVLWSISFNFTSEFTVKEFLAQCYAPAMGSAC